MIRTFVVTTYINAEFLREQPDVARRMAQEQLERTAAKPLRGPRGGRYKSVGPIRDVRDSADAMPGWMMGWHTFAARVDARYIRPRR